MPKEMDFLYFVNDPIWGRIGLTKLEHDIINTDAFNRLRQIKQMSMAYIGHIGAQHTRFEHSIGCMHAVYSLASNIEFLSLKEERQLLNEDIARPETSDLKVLRIAALLHDIGHAPLSHLLESAIARSPYLISDCIDSDYYRELDKIDKLAIDDYGHEMFSIRTIYKDKDIQTFLQRNSIDLDIIAFLISGVEFREIIPPQYKMLKSLISGDIDADRLDYINRDFYFCGTKQIIDMNLLAKAFYFSKDRENHPSIVIDESSIMQATNFLLSRFMLSQTIHNNQDTRINEQAFIDLVRDYLLSLDKEERLKKIFEIHTDNVDADLFLELSKFDKQHRPKEIADRYNVKKRLPYSPRELTNGKASKDYKPIYYLPWKYLHPFWRYYLSHVLANKTLITKIENQLVSLLGEDVDFILDFVSSKPSNMGLIVKEEDDVYELIIENTIGIAHSLMLAAYKSSSVYIYGKDSLKKLINKKSLEFEQSEIQDFKRRFVISDNQLENGKHSFHMSLLKIIEDVVFEHLLNDDALPKELYLLFIMYNLRTYVRDELNHKTTMWIKTEGKFQQYLFSNFKPQFFSEEQEKHRFDVNLHKMHEKLSCWGLIDYVRKPVHLPPKDDNENGKISFPSRIDRNINQWGEWIVDHLCEKIPSAKKTFEEIKNKVKETQNIVKDDLEKLRERQLEQKDKNEYDEVTYEYEKSIRKNGGCIVKFV